MTVAHIPGKANIVADRESRQHHRELEKTINQELYEADICRLSVKPDIDIFASRINYRLKPYVSYKPDAGAVAVDAFTEQWSQYVFYAFPPLSMIMRTLQKIQQDQATGFLILPFWPTQNMVATTNKDADTTTTCTAEPSGHTIPSPGSQYSFAACPGTFAE